MFLFLDLFKTIAVYNFLLPKLTTTLNPTFISSYSASETK